MKTLIIHPQDESTTFLSVIYENIPNKTVVTSGYYREEVDKLIENHDRVMMLGHGSPNGLFSVGQFKSRNNSSGYIIDFNTVKLLSEKKDNVFIWCNANLFVEDHDLNGFYSGMFISEVVEAEYCGLPGTKQDIVDESNKEFCEIISNYITEDTNIIYENVLKEYGKVAENNPVALYNNNRLYKL